ncbi:tRNA (adenosine(37)-N6)-threonylcarbamoyltransferase complex ATPase subunit type 1 TsaE [Paenibacillus sp. M1]|uniref:tRNA threonylcarbamoyladenosine biosynthesis protein TsaE n=1 Tax=Paenibacillus haidiansis TaxID=1574488 RepID=A0ABU7VW27_9BACL
MDWIFDKSSAGFIYKAENLDYTDKLAAFLAKAAVPGSVIALDGDLGAGKTAFSQRFAAYLEVKGTVNSPTFTLIKEYEGRLPFYHMDVYRLSLEEAEELGLDEYFYGQGVTLVEWASLISDILPPEALYIYIESLNGTERNFYIRACGQPYEAWIDTLKENGVL